MKSASEETFCLFRSFFNARSVSETADQFLILLPEALQLLLMVAELFLTGPAGHAGIGPDREPLRMQMIGDLPSGQEDQGHAQQAPGIQMRQEQEGREHHGVIPVIDAAVRTASVLQDKGLERTKEQDADHITDTVCQANQYKDIPVNDLLKEEKSEQPVQGQPGSSRGESTPGRHQIQLRPSGGLIIPGELFLRTHTLQFRREESQDHFDRVYDPDDQQEPAVLLQSLVKAVPASDPVGYTEYGGYDQQYRPVEQFKIMQARYCRQFDCVSCYGYHPDLHRAVCTARHS